MLEEDIPIAPGTVLRRLTAAHAAAFAAHVAHDLDHLAEFLPWPELTADTAGAARWLGAYERREDARVVAAGIRQAGTLAGGGVLFHHEPVSAVVELGIWMGAQAQGTGLATAACRALLAAARRELGVERVVWQSAAGNARSRRLAEKIGFSYEGTARSSLALRGGRLDMDVLSLVGEEIDRAYSDAFP